MRVHRTAKTTPKIRRLVYQRVTQGWTQRAVAEAIGMDASPGGYLTMNNLFDIDT